MRINNIKQLFESYNLQTKEEVILGTIINCQNTVKKLGLLQPKDYKNNELVPLFESVSGINISNQPNFFDNDQVLNIKDYHNNPYAYLNDVKSLMESYIPNESLLLQNDDIKDFTKKVQDYINDLEKINDFRRYENMNEYVLKTKLFTRKPICILGVNLFEIEKLKETLNFKLLYSVIYNKSDKQMLFVGDGIVVVYDIKTDQLGEAHLIDPEIPQLKVTTKNYLEVIKNEINNNLFEIYTDRTQIAPLKFTDNMFLDVKRMQVAEQIRIQNQKNTSVIR